MIRDTLRSRAGDDSGSILLLAIGMVVMAVMFLAVVVDIAALRSARQQLLAHADSAAIAGAHAIDLPTLIRNGYLSSGGVKVVPLDASRAGRAVRDHLVAAGAARDFASLRIRGIHVDRGTVTVDLEARVRPPFASVVLTVMGTTGDMPVRATARSRTQVG
jgi:uncharacterized membrane protein